MIKLLCLLTLTRTIQSQWGGMPYYSSMPINPKNIFAPDGRGLFDTSNEQLPDLWTNRFFAPELYDQQNPYKKVDTRRNLQVPCITGSGDLCGDNIPRKRYFSPTESDAFNRFFFWNPHTYAPQVDPYRRQVPATEGDVRQHQNWPLLDNGGRCGESLSDRIIGGVNASVGQYPWLARVGYMSKRKPRGQPMFRCGGTLINQCHIVTAAHCVTGLPQDLYVAVIRLGEFDSETDIDCDTKGMCADPVQDYYPIRILVHRLYGKPAFKNDISLIKLHRPVRYSLWISPICLPWGNLLTKNLRGEYAEVAGWGVYDLKVPTGSRILQTVKLPIVERERCTEAFRKHAVVDDNQLCVGGIIGQDSCGGDSGGPLMKVDVADDGPRYFLFGIVSFGAKYCAATTMPAVYTKLASYLHWVLNNLSMCEE